MLAFMIRMTDKTEVITLVPSSIGPERKTALVGKVIAEKKISWGMITRVLKRAWSEFGEV